ncbi:hypothetical protein J2D69_17105 [Lysinibacillus sphaericus]|nr:hypothetical protein AR327_09400 [Lysinibacillus sphaericus]MBE5082732.1 hypothetical protein [Bacillus thuringiensis]MBG9724289.1 hypothetical protein [Lysinibacillus fusiformis]AMR92270.1 hypothetical protein A1T07_19810 [Lysinibacillus sphaericus]ANA46319.1 hypothetical protein A2J09_12480 [Lysinibacillus sphaericus]
MKKKKFISKMTPIMVVSGIIFSSISAFATELPESNTTVELPESITMDGKVLVMDKSAGGGSDSASRDNNTMSISRNSYKVTGSDVRLYVDSSHGHGGDHFASGWVDATAPRFTARAEVWSNGRLNTTGYNHLNSGIRANATSYLATGLVPDATPRIFYNW